MKNINKGPVFRRAAGVVIVLVVVVGLWVGFGRKSGPQVTYDTATVDKGTVEKAVSSTGSVAALITVDVGSQISGQIADLQACKAEAAPDVHDDIKAELASAFTEIEADKTAKLDAEKAKLTP